jgi:diacylglycerol kinase family enzyme
VGPPPPYDAAVTTPGRRVVLIVNPYASGVTPERLEQVEAALRATAELETRQTDARGHAVELAAEAAAAADAVVVFSGDGTYNEAINGAAGRVALGFVPGGGASIFPRSLGLPNDPAAAAAQIAGAVAAGRTRTVGLGRVDGRRFCFAAGVGLDAEVIRTVEARGRSAEGRRAGNVAVAATAARLMLRERLRLEPQLEIVDHGRVAFVLVACGRPYTYAGRVPIRLSHGGAGLDFAAPERITPATAPRLVYRLLRGSIAADRHVVAGQHVSAFEIRCDRPLPLQVDGEDLGDVTEVRFEAEPDALAVLV